MQNNVRFVIHSNDRNNSQIIKVPVKEEKGKGKKNWQKKITKYLLIFERGCCTDPRV